MNELSPYSIRRTIPPRGENPAVFDGSVGGESKGFDLREFWRVIRKHSRLILTFSVGVVLTASLIILTQTPIYTAKTILLIERNAPQVVDIQQVLSESLGVSTQDYYKTQYEILKSRSLAAEVIREQGLEKNSLFTGERRDEGLVAGLWDSATRWLKWGKKQVASRFPPPPLNNKAGQLGVNSQVIEAYVRSMLEIKPIQGTGLVEIAFNTPDSVLSARVANAHADAYIHQRLKRGSNANQEAQRFLEEKLIELKGRVEKSETTLNRYRRDKGILSLDDKENIVVERLADLNQLLTRAEAERIGLEAQARLVHKRDYDSLPVVLSSRLIQTLKGQLVRLEGEYAYLSTQFKPGYTRLAQLKGQVEETRGRLEQEIKAVVAGIESAYFASAAKEKELRARMERQKDAAFGLKDASVKYTILAREVDTNRQLYDSVLQRMKEIEMSAELRASKVFIIDKAAPPLKPSRPKKAMNLLLSVLIGLMGGVGLAFFLEHLDNTLKTPEEVERYLRLPSLGVIPDFLNLRHAGGKKRLRIGSRGSVPNTQSGVPSKELVVSHHPLSVVTEAYRTLRTAILLSRAGEPPKTILFTSGLHGEGKTVTAINTAITFAQMGVTVLLIDADLRNSSCHKVLGIENGSGLTDFLTGQTELKKVIKPTAMANLCLLSGGSVPPDPTKLVGSKKMHETLTALQEHYDYIFVDSPPLMPVSDAVLLSTMVDGVVQVVSGQKIAKHVVQEGLARLGYAQAKILGVLLNRMNIQSDDYAYYYPHDGKSLPSWEEKLGWDVFDGNGGKGLSAKSKVDYELLPRQQGS